jgi:hypothetical protein
MKALKLDQLLTDSIRDQALIPKIPLDHFLIVMRSHRIGPSARFQ